VLQYVGQSELSRHRTAQEKETILQQLRECKALATRLESTVHHNVSSKRHRETQSKRVGNTAWYAISPDQNMSNPIVDRQRIVSQGQRILVNFRCFCKQKFGNSLRAWHALDLNGNMHLTEHEFYRGCESIHYNGNSRQLFQFLDRDTSSSISLLEFDARVAMELAAFKLWADASFGNIIGCFRAIDENNDGRITMLEFSHKLKQAGYSVGNTKSLFELLDRDSLGTIHVDEMIFLDKWCPPRFLFCEPDPRALDRFKRQLCANFGGSPLRAWRFGLDKDGSMRVCWREFENACVRYKESLKDVDVARIWRAMDVDLSGWISLREFDEFSFNALSAFKRWVVDQHGTATRAFRALDRHGAGRVRLGDLTASGALDSNDAAAVFEGLDPNGSEVWDIRHLRFLDHWDPEAEQDVHSQEAASRLQIAIDGGAASAIEMALEELDTVLDLETFPVMVKFSDPSQSGLHRLSVEGRCCLELAKACTDGGFQDLARAVNHARQMVLTNCMIEKIVLGNIAVIKASCLQAFLLDTEITQQARSIGEPTFDLHEALSSGDVPKIESAIDLLEKCSDPALSTGAYAGLQRLVSEGQAAAEIIRSFGNASGLQSALRWARRIFLRREWIEKAILSRVESIPDASLVVLSDAPNLSIDVKVVVNCARKLNLALAEGTTEALEMVLQKLKDSLDLIDGPPEVALNRLIEAGTSSLTLVKAAAKSDSHKLTKALKRCTYTNVPTDWISKVVVGNLARLDNDFLDTIVDDPDVAAASGPRTVEAASAVRSFHQTFEHGTVTDMTAALTRLDTVARKMNITGPGREALAQDKLCCGFLSHGMMRVAKEGQCCLKVVEAATDGDVSLLQSWFRCISDLNFPLAKVCTAIRNNVLDFQPRALEALLTAPELSAEQEHLKDIVNYALDLKKALAIGDQKKANELRAKVHSLQDGPPPRQSKENADVSSFSGLQPSSNLAVFNGSASLNSPHATLPELQEKEAEEEQELDLLEERPETSLASLVVTSSIDTPDVEYCKAMATDLVGECLPEVEFQ
jgi:Ca2+-binding EF-hand superfamily protein